MNRQMYIQYLKLQEFICRYNSNNKLLYIFSFQSIDDHQTEIGFFFNVNMMRQGN